MASKWAGEGELQAALKQLEGQRPVQATFVKAVVTTAMKYQNEFKMVVYEVERFIKKCDTDDKIAGIFVIDAICRQSKQSGGKDAFVSRFSQRLKDTISFLSRVSSKDKVSSEDFCC